MEWTAERVAQLRALAERGFSGGMIAHRMGVTRDAICGKARREGISLTGDNHAEVHERRAAAARKKWARRDGSIGNKRQA